MGEEIQYAQFSSSRITAARRARQPRNNAPLRGFKMTTWEGGTRIPFCVQWKGKLPAGKTYDHPVVQLDILPTELAAAGVEVNPEWKLDGVNLLPYLTGEKTEQPHETLYWRYGDQWAVRHGDWKLVAGVGGDLKKWRAVQLGRRCRPNRRTGRGLCRIRSRNSSRYGTNGTPSKHPLRSQRKRRPRPSQPTSPTKTSNRTNGETPKPRLLKADVISHCRSSHVLR